MLERDSMIDIGKGIGSILVILGHTKVTFLRLAIFIDSFHMPFFFILSGMVINLKYSISQFINKKIKSLLINYYILNIILLIWRQIINNPLKCFKKPKIYTHFFKQIFWCAPPYYYYNWFIMSLFNTEIIFFIFYKILRKAYKKFEKKFLNFHSSKNFIKIYYMIFPILSLLLLKYSFYFSFNNFKKNKRRYYFCLDLIPLNSFFLLIGLYLRTNKNSFNFLTKWYFGFLYFFINYSYNKLKKRRFSYVFSENKNFKHFSITSITGSLFIFCVCQFIKKNKLLEYIGRNSIIFYAFHSRISLKFFEKLCHSFVDLSINFKSRIFKFLFVNIGTIIHLIFVSHIINTSFPYILNITSLFPIYINKSGNGPKGDKIGNEFRLSHEKLKVAIKSYACNDL
jgi:fucose 4-O-acetylase-like acetyltransferase